MSLELTEILALADRIVVMSGGQIAGETTPGEVDVTTLGSWMTGGATAASPEPAEAAR